MTKLSKQDGEFKKRLRMLTSFATPYTLTDEENIKINEIIEQLRRINERNTIKIVEEAKKDLPPIPQAVIPNDIWGYWIRQELDHRKKWFGQHK